MRILRLSSHAPATSSVALFMTIQHFFFFDIISSFTPQIIHSHTTRLSRYSTQLFSKRPAAEFELQELRAQFNAMLQQNIRPKMLTEEKRDEIERYVGNVLRNCPSPIPLRNVADNDASALVGNWTMVFASENAALGDLPRDATVQFCMKEGYQCDYQLRFAKTLGLKSITAKSTYTVDASPINPGLVTILYQDIVTDVFGFKSLPVGLFGMLKGRASYVETVWFDGKLWFERGYSPDGIEYYSVYIKERE